MFIWRFRGKKLAVVPTLIIIIKSLGQENPRPPSICNRRFTD
jgi:hypothetical protein